MTRPKKENPSPSETEGTSRRHNRRQALALGGAAAAAAAVAALGMNGGKKAQAASEQPLIIGQGNESNPGDWTGLVGSKTDGPVLHLRNDAEPLQEKWEAVGLDAKSREGTAVVGTTFGSEGFGTRGLSYIGSPDIPSEQWVPGPGIGVDGISGSGPGVRGTSDSGPGVYGGSQSGVGVQGSSPDGVGVLGDSENGTGIVAFSHNSFGSAVFGVNVQPGPVSHDEQGIPIPNGSGPGLQGRSGSGPGVLAISETGLGLLVVGKAAFSTAGAGVVPAKAYTAAVANPAVTVDSHITVTLTDDPGRASVAWVERDSGTGFTVHMSSRPRSDVPFTYLIVEPAPVKGGA